MFIILPRSLHILCAKWLGRLLRGTSRASAKGLTPLWTSHEYPETFDMIAKTDFTTIFSKCWATSTATSWAWRVHLGFVLTSPAGGESAKEMISRRLRQRRQHLPLLRQAAGESGARPADEPPTPPAGEGTAPWRGRSAASLVIPGYTCVSLDMAGPGRKSCFQMQRESSKWFKFPEPRSSHCCSCYEAFLSLNLT